MDILGSVSKLSKLVILQDGQEITVDSNPSTTYTAARTISLPNADSDQELAGLTASQTLTNKTIDADNNTLSNIANSAIKAGAAIALSKLAATTASRVLVSDASGFVSASSVTTTTLGYLDATSSIQTQLDAKQATVTGAASTIVTADLTASRALIANSSGKVAVSAVTDTELGYLDGVTSAIQTQLDAKEDTVTGAASTIVSADLTTDRALVSNSSGKVAVSAVTATELGYLDGVTSAVQTQLDSMVEKAGDTMTGNLVIDNAKEVRFSETDANGSHYIGIKAPDSVTADVTFTLPDGDGSANQVLKTDGSKNLGWATVATVEESLATSAPGTNQSIGDSDESVQVLTPSADIDLTLDNTYSAGRTITVINLATAYDITVKANDGSTIGTVHRSAVGKFICISGTPADSSDWYFVNNRSPVDMSDVVATQQGHRLYTQSEVTVSADATATVAFTQRHLIPYQMSDGSWRLKFNISLTHGSDTAFAVTISGVSFLTGPAQYVGCAGSTAGAVNAYAQSNTSNVQITHGSGATSTQLFGDVALNSKPTWAY